MTKPLFAAAWLAAALTAPGAFAALGDRVSSSAPSAASASRGYSVRESAQGERLKMREYYGADGVVFAVAWEGVYQPELSTVLGRFNEDFNAADGATERKKGVRHRTVAGSAVTVERWGHMPALAGRAYVVSLIPNGVSLDALR